MFYRQCRLFVLKKLLFYIANCLSIRLFISLFVYLFIFILKLFTVRTKLVLRAFKAIYVPYVAIFRAFVNVIIARASPKINHDKTRHELSMLAEDSF